MNVPICSQLYFTAVYLYHYKSRIKYLLEKNPPEKIFYQQKKGLSKQSLVNILQFIKLTKLRLIISFFPQKLEHFVAF